MRTPFLALAAAAALVAPGALRAQVPAEPGSFSVAASLFTDDTGSLVGVWYLLGERLNLGLEFEGNRSTSEETVTTRGTENSGVARTREWTLGPAVKWYGRSNGPVVPYLRAKASWGHSRDELELQEELETEAESSVLLLSAGIGAEWFPISQLSIGAHAGVVWQRREVDNRTGQVDRDRTDTDLRTFRSGIELFYYFR